MTTIPRKTTLSFRGVAFGFVEMGVLYGVNTWISRRFPHWIPQATVNGAQREIASALSAVSLTTAVISFGMLDVTLNACKNLDAERRREAWQQIRGPLLRTGSVAVDIASFLWSIRACTNLDAGVATLIASVAFVMLPRLLMKKMGPAVRPGTFARIVAAASTTGLICILLSMAVTA